MAIRIHHATAKKAKKHGIELSVIENEVVASRYGVSLISAPSADRALAAALKKIEGQSDLRDQEVAEELASGQHDGSGMKGARRKAKKAWSKPVVEETDDEGETGEDGDEGEPEDESRSVVKRKYRTRYRPTRNTCGDDLANLISDHVSVGKGKDRKVDEAALTRFAKANGCWDPNYANLNVGMRRMNIANRLRRKVRKENHEVVWS